MPAPRHVACALLGPELHFPRTAFQNINQGDRVTVQLAIKLAEGSATSGTGATPPLGGGSKSGTREEPGSGARQ